MAGEAMLVKSRAGSKRPNSCRRSVIGLLLIALIAGCGRGAIRPPKINATKAAQAAIEKYDRDGDGILSAAELKQAPAIASSCCDANKDGRVTADEIVNRINKWQTDRVGLMSFHAQITLDGKPLGDAIVTMIPEDCIATQILPAQGTTNEVGLVDPGMDSANMPSELRSSPLMHCGIYRVEITHPKRKIPARYNTETTIGHEVAMDTTEFPYTTFALTSK